MASVQNPRLEPPKGCLARVGNDHSDALLARSSKVFELIAADAPLEVTLAALGSMIEGCIPDSIAGITVLDRPGQTFEAAFFPSLPLKFAQAIQGVPVAPPHVGSCAAAVGHMKTVTCESVRAAKGFDPDWVTLCLAHGINAIQSVPAMSSDGAVLGSFVVGFPMDATVDHWVPEAMNLAAHITGLALEHDRKRKQQELLVGELRHRIRNLFAVMGSLARTTFQKSPPNASSIQTFLDRLNALSRSHCLLDGQNDLSSLIWDTLAPYRGSRSIGVVGPGLILSLEAAQALDLALHELATNAAKYGALSVHDGSLSVTWKLRHGDGLEMFELEWVESNGPVVVTPNKTGFGTAVVQRNLAIAVDARVKINFAPEGVRCSITAPLTPRLGRVATESASLPLHGKDEGGPVTRRVARF